MNNKSATKVREISEETWNDLKLVTFFNIENIIRSARILLDYYDRENSDVLFGFPHVPAGLYTYAVEEYGKLLILESYKPENDKIRLEYDKITNHRLKFEKAFEVLPHECKKIGGDTLSRGSSTSGSNSSVTVEVRDLIPTDFEIRKTIFYSDLDESNKLKMLPQVDPITLRNAIDKLSEIIDKRRPA